jgi:hypothetical protein
MASLDHGMSTDEVEKFGHQLQDVYAAEIKRFVTQIEKLIGNSNGSWVGKDASDFRSWWPAKRAKLTAIGDDLHGYGQSALNNAKEQRAASGEGQGSLSPGLFAYPGGTANFGDGAISRWLNDPKRFTDDVLFSGNKTQDIANFAKDFKDIEKLTGLKDLFKYTPKAGMSPVGYLGFGWDAAKLFKNVADGSVDGGFRSGIDVGFDIAGTAFPTVGLAKGAWDLGWQVGKGIDWVFGEKLGGHQAFIDSVMIDKYGSTNLTVAQADQLSHNYDGWSGFGHFVGDNVKNTGNFFSKLF